MADQGDDVDRIISAATAVVKRQTPYQKRFLEALCEEHKSGPTSTILAKYRLQGHVNKRKRRQ